MNVDVWLANSRELPDELIASLFAQLPAAEQARADRFRVPVPRAEFIVGRTMVRRLISQRTGLHPHEVTWTTTGRGKPLLDSALGWQFNLSHSHGWVALASAGCQLLGLDIECHRTLHDMAALAERCFSPAERSFLDGSPACFFGLWTMKEALLKATGDGIARWPLPSIEVSPEPPAVVRLPECLTPSRTWQAARFDHRAGETMLSGAVCAKSTAPIVISSMIIHLD